VREGNFALEGLLGFDPQPNPACVALGMRYVEMPELLATRPSSPKMR